MVVNGNSNRGRVTLCLYLYLICIYTLSNLNYGGNIMNSHIDYNQELNLIQDKINEFPESISVGELSDRYHTFNELYDHRAKLFISLCLTSFNVLFGHGLGISRNKHSISSFDTCSYIISLSFFQHQMILLQ